MHVMLLFWNPGGMILSALPAAHLRLQAGLPACYANRPEAGGIRTQRWCPCAAYARYELFAVVEHLGGSGWSSSLGHYVAYIRLEDGRWYETDDDEVRSSGPHWLQRCPLSRRVATLLCLCNNRVLQDITMVCLADSARHAAWCTA